MADGSEESLARAGALGTDVAPREPQVTDEERAAALAAGAPKIPRKVVAWGFVVAAALALGGTLAERAFSAAGLNPSAGPTTTTTTTPASGLPTGSALLSFERVRALPAPAAVLRDQRGEQLSLASERGKVVVVTFFNASCSDVCHVLATELRLADADLGRLRRRVVLVTVNTDPLRLAATPAPPAVTATGLDRLANWHYVTGPLRTLTPIWVDLGVTISVYVHTRQVVHNDVLYLVDPAGRLVSRGAPFSDLLRDGRVILPGPLERIAGHALADAVAAELRPGR